MDWGLFKRAVADNEEPTPGYMYRDMAQWTFKDYNTQMKFIDALLKKLKPGTSVHVLYKVLHIIKIVCETGHSDFQKEMQKNSCIEVIKVFVSFRGLPDPRHGDGLNEKVRQAAREAIEATFAPRKEERLNIESGYGNNTGISTNANTNTTVGGMSAKSTFTTGNTVSGPLVGGFVSGYSSNIAPMPATNKWAEHMAQQASTAKASTTSRVFSAIADTAKKLYPGSNNAAGGYKGGKEALYQNALQLGSTGGMLGTTASGGYVPSGGAYDSSAFSGGFQPAEVGTANAFTGTGGNGSNGHGGNGVGAGTSSGWKFIDNATVTSTFPSALEQSSSQPKSDTFQPRSQGQSQPPSTPMQACVQRICQMKSTPQRVELHSFLNQCQETAHASRPAHLGSGNPNAAEGEEEACWEELAEALDTQLAQRQPWQRRLNALVALEALVTSTEAPMRDGVARYFRENPEDVQRNVFVVQSTLRERAQRVVKLLDLPERSGKTEDGTGASNLTASGGWDAMAEATQLQTAGNAMNTFSWSAPSQQTPQAEVDISGMTLRAARRAPRDRTTLKKRAPMRLAEEEEADGNHLTATDVGMGFKGVVSNGSGGHASKGDAVLSGPGYTSAFDFTNGTNNNNNNGHGHHNGGGSAGGNVLDDLFGAPSSSLSPPPPPPPQQQQQQQQASSSAMTFDFMSMDIHSTRQSPPPKPTQPPLPESNVGPMGMRVAPISSPFPPSSPPPSPALLLQMQQQQLQTLMGSLQQNTDPAALAQLQQLLAQQQQLMTLIAQQQQQQQEPGWGGNGASQVVPAHQHFTMGGSTGQGGGATEANAFAAVQQEMMSRLAVPKSE